MEAEDAFQEDEMIIGKGELLGMIGLTGKVNGYSLPVLNCVLLKERENKLSFAWTDLVTSVQVNQLIREDGTKKVKVVVPAKMLQESLELLSDSGITVQLDERGLRVADRKTESMIKAGSCIEPKEFPVIPGRIKGKERELELSELLQGLKNVVFAVSTDYAKENLCGVYAEFHADRLDLTGTDATHLANYTIPGKFAEDTFLLPAEAVRVLLKLKGDKVKVRSWEPKPIKEIRQKKLVQFEVGSVLVTVHVPHLAYPRWRDAVPVEGYEDVVLPKTELVKTLKTAAKIDSTSTFIFAGKKLIVETDNEERKVRQEMPCHGRQEITIKLNIKKLMEGIRQVEGDQVEMGLKKETESIMIRAGNYRYHLMPVQQR